MSDAHVVSTPIDVNVVLVKDDGSKVVDKTLYQSMVGALLYVSMATRPDISHAVGVLSSFCSRPTETHLTAFEESVLLFEGYKRSVSCLFCQ